MAKASKVARLPREVRELVSVLRSDHGWTIDEILGALRRLAAGDKPPLPGTLPVELTAPPPFQPGDLPHRSKFAKHIQGLDKMAEKLHQYRSLAEALIRKTDGAPEDRMARLNIELTHAAVTKLHMTAEACARRESEADDDDGGGDDAAVTFLPAEVMQLARAVKDLTSARKTNVDMTLKLKEAADKAAEKATRQARQKAAEDAAEAAKEAGLSAGTVRDIKARILGVKAPAPQTP